MWQKPRPSRIQREHGERFVFNPHSSLDRGRKVSPVECLQLGYKVNRFDARSPCLTNAIGVSNQETISCSSSEFGGMLNVLWDHSVSQVICGYCEDAYWTIPGYFLRQLSDYPHSTRHTIIQYSEDNNTQYTAEREYILTVHHLIWHSPRTKSNDTDKDTLASEQNLICSAQNIIIYSHNTPRDLFSHSYFYKEVVCLHQQGLVCWVRGARPRLSPRRQALSSYSSYFSLFLVTSRVCFVTNQE